MSETPTGADSSSAASTPARKEPTEEERKLWKGIEELALMVAHDNLSKNDSKRFADGQPLEASSITPWTQTVLDAYKSDILPGIKPDWPEREVNITQKDSGGVVVGHSLEIEVRVRDFPYAQRYVNEGDSSPSEQGADYVRMYIYYNGDKEITTADITNVQSVYSLMYTSSGKPARDLYRLTARNIDQGETDLASATKALERRGFIKPMEPVSPVAPTAPVPGPAAT